MTMPAFYEFGMDVLRAVEREGRSKADLYTAIATARKFSPEQLAMTIPSGQSMFENRVGWVCSWMKKRGWVENPRRAYWQITDAGRARLATGKPMELPELKAFYGENPQAGGEDVQPPQLVQLTPTERIDAALNEIQLEVREGILQRVRAAPPIFFEKLVLHLLKTMGYAGSLGRVEHAGRTGDGGIDGILYLDRLELERVYVQAKRWAGPVGASTIRDFAGSMDGEAATKGVVITTSTFTAEARSYLRKSPKAIRLVDGAELAGLMLEFEVGVARAKTLVLPRVDEDFFEEGL